MKKILLLALNLLLSGNVAITQTIIYPKPVIVFFDPPLVIDPSNPKDRTVPLVELYDKYRLAKTWEEVLAIHTPPSQRLIEKAGMKEMFSYPNPKRENYPERYTAYVQTIESTPVIYAQQIAPNQKDSNSDDIYFLTTLRQLGGKWYYDQTMTGHKPSPLATIMMITKPKDLKEKLELWFEKGDYQSAIKWEALKDVKK
ncbi:MAG: hypothetical protein R3F23_01225 [Verrucomicrobiia bacterium]